MRADIINDGETIPLPSYSDGTLAQEIECHWTVSAQHILMQNGSGIGYLTCSTTGRVVHVWREEGYSEPWGGWQANYMIVATRVQGAVNVEKHTLGQLKARYR